MINKSTSTKRSRLYTLISVIGVTLAATISSVVYSQFCLNCKTVQAISEREPGSLNEVELMQNMSAMPTTDGVTEWNQYAASLSLASTSALSPIQQARVMAIVHVAINDAVNGISRKYSTYLPRVAPPDGASAEAAAISAGYRTLKAQFTRAADQTMLDQAYENSLAAHGISPADLGLPYGQSIADAVLTVRANDGAANAQFDYTVPGAGNPGVWIRLNNAPALLPGWGDVTPFVLRSGSQFRPEAPPALDSEIYARDYNEIKTIGSSTSAVRTAEQTQIANFWRASPTAIWNPVMRQALSTRTFDLSDTARAFALLYLAASDASVACWEAKYYYLNWRPQLAIRGGDLDGNPATDVDPTWLPLLPTPPHPEYPSGHTDNSSAMAHVLESLFGDRLDQPIVVTLSGITREWDSFEQAVNEVIDARVYSGIHFRNTDEVGARQGRQVAQFVLTHALRTCKGNRCS